MRSRGFVRQFPIQTAQGNREAGSALKTVGHEAIGRSASYRIRVLSGVFKIIIRPNACNGADGAGKTEGRISIRILNMFNLKKNAKSALNQIGQIDVDFGVVGLSFHMRDRLKEEMEEVKK